MKAEKEGNKKNKLYLSDVSRTRRTFGVIFLSTLDREFYVRKTPKLIRAQILVRQIAFMSIPRVKMENSLGIHMVNWPDLIQRILTNVTQGTPFWTRAHLFILERPEAQKRRSSHAIDRNDNFQLIHFLRSSKNMQICVYLCNKKRYNERKFISN